MPVQTIFDRTQFTTGQVAKLLKVSPRTVAKWCDREENALTCTRLPNSGDRRIQRDDLIAFIRSERLNMPNELKDTNVLMLVIGGGPTDVCFAGGVNDLFEISFADRIIEGALQIGALKPRVLVILDQHGANVDQVNELVMTLRQGGQPQYGVQRIVFIGKGGDRLARDSFNTTFSWDTSDAEIVAYIRNLYETVR